MLHQSQSRLCKLLMRFFGIGSLERKDQPGIKFVPKNLVSPESPSIFLAIYHRVGESPDMPARFPYFRIHDQRAIDSDHANFLAIRPRRRIAHHILPPGLLDV